MQTSLTMAALAALALGTARQGVAQDDDRARRAEAAIVRSVTGTARGADVYLLDEPREISDGLWFALAGRTAGRTAPTLHACTVEDPSAPRVSCALLATPGVARAEQAFDSDSLRVSDFDGDGATELMVQVNYSGARTDVTRLFIVNLDPRTRVAFALETRRFTESSGRSVTQEWSFADENGDGHDDIVVEQTSCVSAFWKTSPTPARRGSSPPFGAPAATSPWSVPEWSRPFIARRSVVLPQPDGPVMHTHSPARATSDTSESAGAPAPGYV